MVTALAIVSILFLAYIVWSRMKIKGLKESNDYKSAAIEEVAINYKLIAYYAQQTERKGIDVNYEHKIRWSIGKDREWIKAIEECGSGKSSIVHEKVDTSHLFKA